ncbi:MAG TPA: hypothetical protein DD381_01725 [Lentisphaeria bacterium]|nr:MAG: hypothetical protein A2X47_10305 [Lentisphaerae bacterium GWF2_38_69]HBM15061.1 hypothetical protein [Lentisphaeria bacterium]
MQYFLGIEVGTTRVKTAIYDIEGNQITEETSSHVVFYDKKQNSAESPVLNWWFSVKKTIRKALLKVDPKNIKAICVGSHGPSLVALDKKFNPVGNSILWMDRRGSNEAEFLSKKLGLKSNDLAWFIPRAMYLRNNSPESYKKVRYFVQPLDYINCKLTGIIRTSIVSDTIKIWNEKTIAASSLPRELFPKEIKMGETLGTTSKYTSEETGLPLGVPVIAGTGGADFLEVLISSGSLKKGIVCDRGGSSQGVNMCWDTLFGDKRFFEAPHPLLKGLYHISGLMATTGKALHWYKNLYYGKGAGFEKFFEDASKSPPGSKRLIFLPYLTGERTPWWDPNARGVFFGLSLEHTKHDIVRAILEGTGFGINHMLRLFKQHGAAASEIRVCGGQAKSPLWNQIKADITNLPVVTNKVTDGSTLGLAIIAGFGAGVYKDIVSSGREIVKVAQVYEPNESSHRIYSQMQPIYENLYPLLKTQFKKLSSI